MPPDSVPVQRRVHGMHPERGRGVRVHAHAGGVHRGHELLQPPAASPDLRSVQGGKQRRCRVVT
eukprot:619785-Rhodomonas_salina.6